MNDLENSVLDQFNELKEHLKKWGDFVDKEIVKLLTENSLNGEIKIFPDFRLKTDRSFLSKALWRDKNYKNPVLEIEDKVGTRVVLLKSSDIEPVAKVFLNGKNWLCKVTKNLKESIEGQPTQFHYQSMHVVVSPIKENNIFDEKLMLLLTCEIQIRTLLQHAFAEISHDSTYKGPYKNDVDIIRSLSKSMALMEATDDYFIHIFELMADITRKFRGYINELTKLYVKFNPDYDKKDLDIPLTDTLFELLSKKDIPVSDIEELTKKKNDDIRDAIENRQSHLFGQPVSLLVYYYLFNYPAFLKDNWPLSNEARKLAFEGFGYNAE
jgi:putative GTP pyrophosphokinase